MDSLTIKDAISLYQSQVGIVNALWTFFGTVTLAVVGYAVGSQKATRSASEVAMIVGGYALFAVFGNLTALRSAYTDLAEFSVLVDDRMSRLGKVLPAVHFTVPSVEVVTFFHIGMVTVVAVAIVVYAMFRPRHDE